MLNRLHSIDPDRSCLPSASNAVGLNNTELDELVSGNPRLCCLSLRLAVCSSYRFKSLDNNMWHESVFTLESSYILLDRVMLFTNSIWMLIDNQQNFYLKMCVCLLWESPEVYHYFPNSSKTFLIIYSVIPQYMYLMQLVDESLFCFIYCVCNEMIDKSFNSTFIINRTSTNLSFYQKKMMSDFLWG